MEVNQSTTNQNQTQIGVQSRQFNSNNKKLFVIVLISILLTAVIVGSAVYFWQKSEHEKMISDLKQKIFAFSQQSKENTEPVAIQNTTSNSYPSYKKETHESQDGKWKIVTEYLSDFDSTCQGRINISRKEDDEYLFYQDIDGWRGGYLFKCSYDILSGREWISTFSGWDQNSEAFFVIVQSNEDPNANNILYAYLDTGSWKVRGFPIEGIAVERSNDLGYILTANSVKVNNVQDKLILSIYSNEGIKVLSKETYLVYEPRYQKIENSDLVFVLIPTGKDPDNPDLQKVSFYLIDFRQASFTLIGSDERELTSGSPCEELEVNLNNEDNTIIVSGECLDSELSLEIK